MNIDVLGRRARTIEEATEYMLLFIARSLQATDYHVIQRSHAYDLYIPWLIEVVHSAKVESDEPLPSPTDQELLYMDASWSMCQAGLLRPGPRRSTGEVTADGLGKGWSLTPLGREKVDRIIREQAAAAAEAQARSMVG